MNPAQSKYVDVGGAQVAYQVTGEGTQDLAVCHALGWQLDLSWQNPFGAEFMGLFRRVCRVIDFDRRGSGNSDPVPSSEIPTWETLAEDLTAVLDEAGSERTAVMGILETGPIALLFAAMHPERVSHLILMSTTARFLEADDYPMGAPSEVVDAVVDVVASSWGSEEFMRPLLPNYAEDPEVIAACARMFRASATPRCAADQYDYFLRNVDVRNILQLVEAPSLVLHSSDASFIPFAQGRYLADHLPHAKLIEWQGAEGDPPESVYSDIAEFLTGERPAESTRILTTVLFTDIVGSTEHAASVGDKSWRLLLDAHDRLVREQLRRFKGREVKMTGDGFVVSFDGPARAIQCARSINDAIEPLGVDLKIGLHTGECEVRGDDLGGLTVHIAARIGALAMPREILVSSTIKDLVIGSSIEFLERGQHDLKGVPGIWDVFAVA
jgi:class 3 adenylate cyclase